MGKETVREILKFDVGGIGFKKAAYLSLLMSFVLLILGFYFIIKLLNEF